MLLIKMLLIKEKVMNKVLECNIRYADDTVIISEKTRKQD